MNHPHARAKVGSTESEVLIVMVNKHTGTLMTSLDSRSIRILKILLETEGCSTTPQIAAALALSPKMVRYRLEKINPWLTARGVTLRKEGGKGIWLEAEETSREAIREELRALSGYELILSPDQRQQILLFTLLLENEPVIVKKLALDLGVSRSTLFSDLDDVEDWIQQRRLHLNRKPGYGVALEGHELDIRKALVTLITEHMGSEKLLPLLLGKGVTVHADTSSSSSLLSCPICTYFNSLQTGLAYEFAHGIEEWNKIQFPDYSMIRLVLYISIMIVRIAQGKTFRCPGERVDQITNHPYFSNVLIGLKQLGNTLNLPIPLDEMFCLMSVIMRVDATHEGEAVTFSYDDRDIVEQLSSVLPSNAALDPNLLKDEGTLQRLTDIFAAAVERQEFSSHLHHPLLEDVQALHPDVYALVDVLRERLSARFQRPVVNEEATFISMHLLAVMEVKKFTPKTRVLIICAMGAVTSELLAHRLRAEFPEIEIVAVLSVREFLANPTLEADAIISTEARLPVQSTIPIFHVHPLLKREDVHGIKEWQLEQEAPSNGGDQ